MAIAGIQIAERVKRQAERIDLSMRDVFNAAAVGPDAIGVARGHGDGGSALALDSGRVGEPVAAVNPAVETAHKLAGHAVGVFETIGVVEYLALVGLAVGIGV